MILYAILTTTSKTINIGATYLIFRLYLVKVVDQLNLILNLINMHNITIRNNDTNTNGAQK